MQVAILDSRLNHKVSLRSQYFSAEGKITNQQLGSFLKNEQKLSSQNTATEIDRLSSSEGLTEAEVRIS